VFLALVYLLLRRVVWLVARSSGESTDTEVELVVLRHQLNVLKRQVSRPRLRRRDRLFMAALSKALPRGRWASFLVSPQTLLRWHRELVRGKWTFRRRSAGGRPPIPDQVRELILRMGRRTPGGGASGSGESSPSSASGSPRQRAAPSFGRTAWARLPAERVRPGASSWGRRAQGILALDFFTVETITLRTMYVLFAIHLGSRRLHVLGVTRNPDSAWVTQQARNLAVGERLGPIRLHGRPPASGSGNAACWAGSSVSTTWLLDRRIKGFCVPQATGGARSTGG
jgi:putative transposase